MKKKVKTYKEKQFIKNVIGNIGEFKKNKDIFEN